MAKSKQVEETPRATSRTENTKIWILDEWYVEVDAEGYAVASVEGTLGAILKLMPRRPDVSNRLALKVPRLLADTIQENAYICEITLDELENVFTANQDGAGGLVSAQIGSLNSTHKRRSLEDANAESAELQHRHVLFFQFNKRKNPRVCSVNWVDGELSVFPQAAKSEFEGLIDESTWNDLVEASKIVGNPNESGRAKDFQEPVYVLKQSDRQRANSLQSEMSIERIDDVWYAGLPGITFEWVGITLQNALSENTLSHWKLEQYFLLFDRIMRGVETLHKKGLLHCDLRPANIMGVGKDWTPEEFFVGDYGSFSVEKARFKGAPSGHTMIGPGVGNTRATPFYSLERRAGVERENVDTAIIIRDTGNSEDRDFNGYIVRLAWSRSFFVSNVEGKKTYDETNSVTPELRAMILKEASDLISDSAENTQASKDQEDLAFLQKGDRLRTRDYVFEVISASTTEDGGLICRCADRFAHVLHDRLAVYDSDNRLGDEIVAGIDDGSVLSLPYYTEFKQWSAATDLYGVGAISLYCLFVEGQRLSNREKSQTHQVHIDRRLEILFAEMLDILESIPYFQSYWEDLERFTNVILELEETHPDGVPIEKVEEYRIASVVPETTTDSPQENSTEKNKDDLKTYAITAVNNIVQSAPHIRCLLYPFDFNVGAFLVFMHFVMGCIHRQSHLDSKSSVQSDEIPIPFCKDRLEMPPTKDEKQSSEEPDSKMPISYAREYLDVRVKNLIKKDWFRKAFRVEKDDEQIGRFDPRNRDNIQREANRLEMERKSLEIKSGEVDSEISKKREKLEKEIQDKTRELKKKEKQLAAEIRSQESRDKNLIKSAEAALALTGLTKMPSRLKALEGLAADVLKKVGA